MQQPQRNYQMSAQPSRRRPCRHCGNDHMDRDCSTLILNQPSRIPGCFNCGKPGYYATSCTESDQRKKCFKCSEQGHYIAKCQAETAKKVQPSIKMQKQQTNI